MVYLVFFFFLLGSGTFLYGIYCLERAVQTLKRASAAYRAAQTERLLHAHTLADEMLGKAVNARKGPPNIQA